MSKRCGLRMTAIVAATRRPPHRSTVPPVVGNPADLIAVVPFCLESGDNIDNLEAFTGALHPQHDMVAVLHAGQGLLEREAAGALDRRAVQLDDQVHTVL